MTIASPVEVMPRPTFRDSFVRQRAAEIYKPRIVEWFDGERFAERTTMQDLMNVVAPSKGGYEMASELDRLGWAVNDSLVEVLKDCSDDCFAAVKELTLQWVKCYQIKADFAVGDTVAFKRNCYGQPVGEVVQIYDEEAKYGVRVSGQRLGASFIVLFEEVRSVAEVQA